MINATLIKRIMIGFVVAVIILIVYGIASHGRLSISNIGDEELQIVNISKNSLGDETTIKNGAIVKSGLYAVRNDKSSDFRLANVTVPGWLQSVEVTYSSQKHAQIDRAAALTYENFLQTNSGKLISFTNTDGALQEYSEHNTGDAFGGKTTNHQLYGSLSSPVTTNDGNVIGVGMDGELSTYSFDTGITTTIPLDKTLVMGDDTTGNLFRSKDSSSTSIGVYTSTDNTVSLFTGNGKRVDKTLSGNSHYTGNFDINNTDWAYITSDGKLNENDDNEVRSFFINISPYDKDSLVKIDIGSARAVNEIAISPDSKHVAVIKNDQLWVYAVSSKKVVFVDMFTNPNQLFWNKNNLYSVSVEGGIIRFNTDTMQSSNVLDNSSDKLNFTNILPLGSKIFLTAYTKNNDSNLPDGYIVDLNKEDNGLTAKLSAVLPTKGSDYEASFLGSTIYIRPITYPSDETPEAYNERLENIKKKVISDLEKELGKDVVAQYNFEVN